METSDPRLLLEFELNKSNPDTRIIELLESLIYAGIDPDLDMVGVALSLGGEEVTKSDD